MPQTSVDAADIQAGVAGDMPSGELRELLIAIGFGLVGGLIGLPLTLGMRWMNNEPVLPLRRPSPPITSPRIFYVGIVFFAGMAVMSITMERPLFGTAFLIGAGLYGWGLAKFRKRSTGN